jgi:large subunit ribosomal protein L18
MKKQKEKRLRLAVFRSNKYISAQIIDDEKGITLVGASEKDLAKGGNQEKKDKSTKAALVGEVLALRALKKKIKKVRFDRRHYHYQGRIKALAEAARKGGLDF